MGCNNNGGLFGGNNDWIWIVVGIIVICFLTNEGGLFGNDCCDRC